MLKKKQEKKMGRREFIIKGACFLGGFLTGAGTKLGEKAIEKIILVLEPLWNPLSPTKPDFNGIELLLSDNPKMCGIIPGDTNKHLFEQQIFKASRYVKGAFDQSKRYLSYITAAKKEVPSAFENPNMLTQANESQLIIGGPVASIQTRKLCGYEEITTRTNPKKLLPQFRTDSKLPWGFYLGNKNGWGYWGNKRDPITRWYENGKEGTDFDKYGIIRRDSRSPIEPPIDKHGRLAGDMLMIIRLPNQSDGYFTIIGGMHGYSLDAFYKHMKENMNELSKIVSMNHTEYFQILIPARIISPAKAIIDWDGWGNWRPAFEKLNPNDFLVSCP